jgi:hypothetical protein
MTWFWWNGKKPKTKQNRKAIAKAIGSFGDGNFEASSSLVTKKDS